jgi:signal peptidase I
MRRSFHRITRVATGLLAGSVVTLVVAYAGLVAAGYRPVAVYSGSMTPTIPVGGLAIDKPITATNVRVGDVITFSDPYVKGRLVTHRVIRVLRTPQGLAYRTKGDANPSRDPWTIRLSGRVGRVSYTVPLAGYVLVYAHTREIRGILILLAGLVLLLGLLRRIWNNETTAAARV